MLAPKAEQTSPVPGQKDIEDIGWSDRAKIVRILLAQVLVVLVLTVVGWFTHSEEAALSILVGGAIGFIGALWLAIVIFRPTSKRKPDQLVVALYIGELGRFLFVMAFFALAFKKLAMVREPQNALFMLGAFAITQLVIWIWPLLGSASKGRMVTK